MNDPLSDSRAARARVIGSIEDNVILFRENPLFEYFSDDERADSVIIFAGSIVLVGEAEIDPNFQRIDSKNFRIVPPYFQSRIGERSKSATDDWFIYPLYGERKFLIEQRTRLSNQMDKISSEIGKEDTERDVSELIRNRLCGQGFHLYYQPIVSFDENTKEIWNKPGDVTLKKIMYIEVAARVKGMTVLYSNSFIAASEEQYLEGYKKSIEGVELVKQKFIEGGTTEEVSKSLEGYRHRSLYLTTPLYPFSYHPIPGPDATIHTGDTAVFDLWLTYNDFCFRRKVVAIAGNYRATTI